MGDDPKTIRAEFREAVATAAKELGARPETDELRSVGQKEGVESRPDHRHGRRVVDPLGAREGDLGDDSADVRKATGVVHRIPAPRPDGEVPHTPMVVLRSYSLAN